jgi:hypothetical protein
MGPCRGFVKATEGVRPIDLGGRTALLGSASRGVFLFWSRRDIPPFYLETARHSFAAQCPGVPLVAIVDDVLPPFLRQQPGESPAKMARYRDACIQHGYAGMVCASDLDPSLSAILNATTALSVRDLKAVLPPYKTRTMSDLPMQEVGVLMLQLAILDRAAAELRATHAVCGNPWLPFMQTFARLRAPNFRVVSYDHLTEDLESRTGKGFLVGGRETRYGS